MTLSQIRQTLAARGIQLTSSLGQNFLHDGNQLRRIVEAADLKRSDRVLEIGPGLGPLTDLLLKRAGEVLAIEKDRRLFECLRQRFNVGQAASLAPPLDELSLAPGTGEMPVLRLVQGDALEFLRREARDWSAWKLVANLPYSVASPILVELAQAACPPSLLVVTLQWEVVRRLAAQAGEPDYGVLTLLVQRAYEPHGWFKIPASCFFPEPAVDSGCVTLRRRPQPLLAPAQVATFTRLVKASFSQRRKMMLKLLKGAWPAGRAEAAFAQVGLAPQVRAEAVSLEQFLALTRCLSSDDAQP